MRTKAEVMNELEEIGDSLAELMKMEGAVYVVDLQFFANKVKDLKHELRTVEAVENAR